VLTRQEPGSDVERYELAEHHHHLICSTCGDVTDFSLDTHTETNLARALHRAASQADFNATAHRLDLIGTCAGCT